MSKKIVDDIHTTPQKACYPFHRGEVSPRSVFLSIYSKDCEVDLRRWLSDFRPVDRDSIDQSGPKVDCPIPAAVYSQTSRLLLAIAVFFEEISEEEFASVQSFCQAYGIRFFPLERLESYPVDILERSTLCEQLKLEPMYAPHIVPAARCPECNSPLVHKIKWPTSRRNGLYYACPSYLGSPVSCSGFICGADEIFEHFDHKHRDGRYRVQIDLEAERNSQDWA